MLAEPGILVSFVPVGFFFHKVSEVAGLRALVEDHGDSIELPAGTFKTSGTDAASGLITLCKGIRAKPHAETYASHDAHELALFASNSRVHYETRLTLFGQARAGRYVISPEGQTDVSTGRMIFEYFRKIRAAACKEGAWLRFRREVEFVSLREEFIDQYLEWALCEAR